MRVLVCGGRGYKTFLNVWAKLDALAPTVIIQGGAAGADSFAADWAREHHVTLLTFVADWEQLGKAAGPRRNREMLVHGQPDLVLAFPGGNGTENMKRQARAMGVNIVECD